MAGPTINSYTNPIFTEKLDKTELPVQTCQHVPYCVREKMLVLCVGEMRKREEINALFSSFLKKKKIGKSVMQKFQNKRIYTSAWIPKFLCNSGDFQLT